MAMNDNLEAEWCDGLGVHILFLRKIRYVEYRAYCANYWDDLGCEVGGNDTNSE